MGLRQQHWYALARNYEEARLLVSWNRILVRWRAEKQFSESSVFFMRRLSVIFKFFWSGLLSSFEVIERSSSTIYLLKTSVLR